MGIKEQYDFENLINEAERLVLEVLENRLADESNAEVCDCQDCVLDMAALALNNVNPLYRVSLIGTLYAHSIEEGSEYHVKVTKAVEDAVAKVAANPSCE